VGAIKSVPTIVTIAVIAVVAMIIHFRRQMIARYALSSINRPH